jgi:hypothetical protein
MVLVFSEKTNGSIHVRSDVGYAVEHELTIIPFRIQNVLAKGTLEYYLKEIHWLDALTLPLEQHIKSLTLRVGALMRPRGKVSSQGHARQAN